jgi:hypothetical protein
MKKYHIACPGWGRFITFVYIHYIEGPYFNTFTLLQIVIIGIQKEMDMKFFEKAARAMSIFAKIIPRLFFNISLKKKKYFDCDNIWLSKRDFGQSILFVITIRYKYHCIITNSPFSIEPNFVVALMQYRHRKSRLSVHTAHHKPQVARFVESRLD